MKAVIYARFSSEKQHEASIEGQLRECMQYANYNDIQVVGNYIDRAYSAKTDHRPEFQRRIKDSYKNLFDAIIVWKLDRFARNRYDSARYKHILKKNGVKVISATEVIAEGSLGILLESMLEGYAEYYSVELAEKVKRGMMVNALKAKANGVRPPFGYFVDSEGHFQIDETTAPIVKEIYSLYAGGTKINQIVELMKSRGITHRGYEMNYNAIFRMLTNRKYIGEYKFGDVVLPDAIPAIVTPEIFEKIQTRFKTNKKAPAMHRSKDDYLLTTKLFCGKCGAMMTGEIGTSATKAKYRYYKCNHAKKHKCDKKAVKKDWIENLVIHEILNLISDDKTISDLTDCIYEFQQKEDTAVSFLENKLADVKSQLDNVVKAITQGIFSSATKQILDDLETLKSDLEAELAQAQIKCPILTKEQIQYGLYSYKTLDLHTQEGKQRLIDGFVNSIFLYDDRFIITFNYKGNSKTVTFEQVNSINSSPLTTKGLPYKKEQPSVVLFLCCPITQSYFLVRSPLTGNH